MMRAGIDLKIYGINCLTYSLLHKFYLVYKKFQCFFIFNVKTASFLIIVFNVLHFNDCRVQQCHASLLQQECYYFNQSFLIS